MIGYIPAALGDRYRIVYYLGKKWCRVESGGFWGPARTAWTTVVHHPDQFYGVAVAFKR